MTDNSKRTGPALEAHYRFLLWLIQATEKFPRSHKFTIGDRVHNAVANRTDLNWRHGSTCSGSNCQLTAGASPRTDKRSLPRDAQRQAGQARQRRRDVSHDRL